MLLLEEANGFDFAPNPDEVLLEAAFDEPKELDPKADLFS